MGRSPAEPRDISPGSPDCRSAQHPKAGHGPGASRWCNLDGAGHVHELYVVAGGRGWAHADLSALTAAPAAVAGSRLSGYQWDV